MGYPISMSSVCGPTAGKITTLAPTAGGNINHYVGRAVGPQTLDIEIGYPILL